MKPFRDDAELADALREIRPAPRPDFAAALDARAVAGFRRDSRWASAISRVRARLDATPPRRLLAPAGAFAIACVVIATTVVAINESGGPTTVDRIALNSPDPERPIESTAETPPREGNAVSNSAAGSTSSSGSGAIQYGAQLPTAASGSAVATPSRHSGPYASQAGHRDIERSADVVLDAEPSEVRGAATKVFDAVHAADGIVLNSSIRDGEAGTAGADFELLIPSARLSDALASFSSIAEVRSRHETTQDITAPTVSTGEKLQESRAKIESLLGELADAKSDAERTAVEAQLRSERYRAAALRSGLSALERRGNFSRVSLRIETGAAASGGTEGGGWGIDDGLDDAGRILAVAAGVTVIGLAILAPFALLALIAWLGRRAWIRRARRHALART
jgi:hypothetical protein